MVPLGTAAEVSIASAAPVALCPVAAIAAGRARGFDPTRSGEDTVFVVQSGAGLRVFLNKCPHQGVPLEYRKDAFLSGDGEHIMCYAHGARFERQTGRCIHGPCLGESLQPLPHRVAEGWVWLDDPSALFTLTNYDMD
jgi:nitrite reductase/ring-hydroxylating ferredoxin subunit